MMLKVEDINVYYGQIHAIKGISFHVDEGEIVSLIGANGAGKTTTLKTVSGLMRSRGGSITFLDRDIGRTDAHKLVSMGLAHVPEGRRIFLQMTVEENLEMGAYTSKGDISKDLEYVYGLFPRLEERKRQIGGTLSGGEQQMLAIGRRMMSHPKLLLLDEPSMGLAPILVGQIFDIIKELHRQGPTILHVEQTACHILAIHTRLADECPTLIADTEKAGERIPFAPTVLAHLVVERVVGLIAGSCACKTTHRS